MGILHLFEKRRRVGYYGSLRSSSCNYWDKWPLTDFWLMQLLQLIGLSGILTKSIGDTGIVQVINITLTMLLFSFWNTILLSPSSTTLIQYYVFSRYVSILTLSLIWPIFHNLFTYQNLGRCAYFCTYKVVVVYPSTLNTFTFPVQIGTGI